MRCLLSLFFLMYFSGLLAQEDRDFYVTKGKGIEFHMFDDQYLLQFDIRGQFRASFPYESFPVDQDDFLDENVSLGISRARIKIGGHVFSPDYTFYFEQDIRRGNLLDFRAQFERLAYLKLRVGQWKARFSRERVISSGKQTVLERSLINRVFTIDRQQGASLYGDLEGSGMANFSYWFEALVGNGRGENIGDDGSLMYMLRMQWNPNGTKLGFSGSDLKFHERFTSSIALAGVTNTSPYTRFSTDGGGQLPGFEDGVSGQYKVDQLMLETAFKYRGISFQQELHYKNIDDRINLTETAMVGNYIQASYFFHHLFPKIPEKLEFFGRWSIYDPDIDLDNNNNSEYTVGLNWFFHGHKNKLTFDYSYIDYDQYTPNLYTDHRFRLQWDVSIF